MQMVNRFGLQFGLAQKILGSNAAPNPISTDHNQRVEGKKLGFAGANIVKWHVDTAEVEFGKFPFVAYVDHQRAGLLPARFQSVQVNIDVGC